MGIGYRHFRNSIFFYIIVLSIISIGVVSYYRFIVNNDYIVSYEGSCDPVTENCFKGCEDETCTEEYYYTNVQKYAADLYAQCGGDITECEAAAMCFSGDRNCTVEYCDLEKDGELCETITEVPEISESATSEPEKTIVN